MEKLLPQRKIIDIRRCGTLVLYSDGTGIIKFTTETRMRLELIAARQINGMGRNAVIRPAILTP
jgi:sirohydrochlorin ferrochelatase